MKYTIITLSTKPVQNGLAITFLKPNFNIGDGKSKPPIFCQLVWPIYFSFIFSKARSNRLLSTKIIRIDYGFTIRGGLVYYAIQVS